MRFRAEVRGRSNCRLRKCRTCSVLALKWVTILVVRNKVVQGIGLKGFSQFSFFRFNLCIFCAFVS